MSAYMPKSPVVNKTILKNFSGNLFGVLVNFFNQIVLVPIYLSYWGIEMYGDWIALSAISNFLAMSDMGLNTVTNNRYSISYNQGKFYVCDALLSNNALLIIMSFSLILIVGIPLMIFGDVKDLFSLRSISVSNAIIVLTSFVTKIFINMFSGVYCSIYRAVSKAYITFYCGNLSRLSEALLIILGLFLTWNVSVIAVLCVVPYVLLLFFYIYNTRKEYGIVLKINKYDKSLFFSLLKPSLSFMSFPLGYAIILQGFTLIVNRFFGASEVVLYNTTRTMCNFIKVIPNAIKNSVWPEVTNHYAKRNLKQMRLLHDKTLFVVVCIILLVAFIYVLFGEPIYMAWTKNAVLFSMPLMLMYMLCVLFNSLWETSGMILMATNKHTKIGLSFLFFSLSSFMIAVLLGNMGRSLLCIVGVIVLVDFFMAIIVIRQTLNMMRRKIC